MEKICANCIYFHPEEYEEEFGGCSMTIDHKRRAFCAPSCVDYTEFEVVDPKEPTFEKKCLSRTEIDVLIHSRPIK